LVSTPTRLNLKYYGPLSNFACFAFNCNLRHYTQAIEKYVARRCGLYGANEAGPSHFLFSQLDFNPVAAGCRRLLPVVAGCCRLPPVAAGCRRLLPVVAGCCRLFPIVPEPTAVIPRRNSKMVPELPS